MISYHEKKAEERGSEKQAYSTAQKMLQKNYSLEEIEELMGLANKEILALQNKI